MLSNANQEYYPIMKLSNEIINQKCKQVCYSKIIQYAMKRYYVFGQERLHVMTRNITYTDKSFRMY